MTFEIAQFIYLILNNSKLRNVNRSSWALPRGEKLDALRMELRTLLRWTRKSSSYNRDVLIQGQGGPAALAGEEHSI